MQAYKEKKFGLQAYLNNSTGKEHALIISNHRSDIDWLIGWILAQVVISHLLDSC
jgi:1-acyl-sn-glycerol-3-phosphate acyltransferase